MNNLKIFHWAEYWWIENTWSRLYIFPVKTWSNPIRCIFFRLFLEGGSDRLPWYWMAVSGCFRSDSFRRNPSRNPLVRIPVKTGGVPIGFVWESGAFRCSPTSDPMEYYRILRSDQWTWVIENIVFSVRT